MVIQKRQVNIRFEPTLCNQANSNVQVSNRITTAKYSYSTFVPKFLMEQFRRYSNIFFSFIALFQQIPDVSPTGPYTTAVPLLCIMGVSAIKELYEDMKRHKADAKINESEISVLNKATLIWDLKKWQDVKVGDIVRCVSESFFPSDMLLISSSEAGGMCYIETANLDGETNLKIRQSPNLTAGCSTSSNIKSQLSCSTIECDPPNAKLYEFEGQLILNDGETKCSLGPDNVLLRGAKLKNTGWIYGVVLYTGHESKLMINSLAETPAKQSKLEKITNTHILWLVFILLTTSFLSAIFSAIWTFGNTHSYIFNTPDISFNFPMTFLTFVILYNNLVPISLQVSLEVVRTFQAHFINSDFEMYDKHSGTFAMARTSNLNEELGQVKYILSDKTGTLTRNIMNFKQCTINGQVFDENSLSEAAQEDVPYDYQTALSNASTSQSSTIPKTRSQFINEFLTLLATCHTVVPETNSDSRIMLRESSMTDDEQHADNALIKLKDQCDGPRSKKILDISDSDVDTDIDLDDHRAGIKLTTSSRPSIVYHAASPDEAALVKAAQRMGFEFTERTPHELSAKKFGEIHRFDLLEVFEFDSDRKRMSVVLRCQETKTIKIYTKGADTVIYERLSNSNLVDVTSNHIQQFAHNGLRTLCCAYAEISEAQYKQWSEKFKNAHLKYGDEKTAAIESCIDELERNLILLGATAIEDKLQDEVPETIDTLLKAGINFWLLTGDKQETAINIGFSSKLLSRKMQLIVINEETFDATRDLILSTHANAECALVIDGKSLHYALSPEVRDDFMREALKCKSVICCRVSPFQKATMVESVKDLTGQITLAIGDGANDVAMIRSANIGVGISGNEGLQAAHSADYTISQFRFLARLLLVHGSWSMSRLKKMILYSFYKNIALYIVEFWFAIVSGWSGQTIFERWTIGLYNVIFTAMPPFAIGVFDRKCSADHMMKHPHLYQKNLTDQSYGTRSFWLWIATAFWHSLLLFWFTYFLIYHDALWSNGKSDGGYLVFGCILYTYVVVTVCLKAGLEMSSWTYLTHIAIWGSIAIWLMFLLIYSRFWPTIPFAADMTGIDNLVYGTCVFWAGSILVPFTALLADILLKVLHSERMTMKICNFVSKNGLKQFCC